MKLLQLPPPPTKMILAKQIGNFGKIRVNVQEENRSDVYQMERHSVSKATYQPGELGRCCAVLVMVISSTAFTAV